MLTLFALAAGTACVELFLQAFPRYIPSAVKDEIIKKDVKKYWVKNAYSTWYTYWSDDPTLGLKRPSNWNYRVEREFYGEAVWGGHTVPVKDFSGGVDATYDRDGFRNRDGLARADVVTLGDSLTEGLYIPRPWPELLGGMMGVDVCNLGTGHFGPAQEEAALVKYGVSRRPGLVILAFYEGNDVEDNEKFDAVKKSGLPWHKYDEKTVRRKVSGEGYRFGDTIVWTMARYAYGRVFHGGAAPADNRPPGVKGWFTYATPKGEMGFAVLPPKFKVSLMTREEIAARPGWAMTVESIRSIRAACDGIGASFVVVFIPTQEHVALPLVLDGMGGGYFDEQMAILMKNRGGARYAERFGRDADNLSAMMSELCASEGIPFLDLTGRLRDETRMGGQAYFPRDSHFNMHGADVAAGAIYGFLKDKGITGGHGHER